MLVRHDSLRRIIHHDLNTGSGFQSTDITSLTTDDTAFDLVRFNMDLIESLKDEAKTQAASYINEIVEEAKMTANKEAKKIVIKRAISRRTGSNPERTIASGVSSTTISIPVAASQARKLSPPRANKEAKKIVIQSIQRVATETAIENSITVFHIESDEIKGRIIGREGRNSSIRAGWIRPSCTN